VDRASEALIVLDRELEPVVEVDEEGQEYGVDLILTDITLAGERDGVELAREAKVRGIAVLFATGDPPVGAEALAVGHLLKPYNDRTLKAALKAVDRHLSGDRVTPPDGLVFY